MIGTHPVITIGTVGAILVAGWNVIVAQGLLAGLTPAAADALTVFINLLIPIAAAWVASRFVTPVESPVLPVGTIVNKRDDSKPDAVVTKPGDVAPPVA